MHDARWKLQRAQGCKGSEIEGWQWAGARGQCVRAQGSSAAHCHSRCKCFILWANWFALLGGPIGGKLPMRSAALAGREHLAWVHRTVRQAATTGGVPANYAVQPTLPYDTPLWFHFFNLEWAGAEMAQFHVQFAVLAFLWQWRAQEGQGALDDPDATLSNGVRGRGRGSGAGGWGRGQGEGLRSVVYTCKPTCKHARGQCWCPRQCGGCATASASGASQLK